MKTCNVYKVEKHLQNIPNLSEMEHFDYRRSYPSVSVVSRGKGDHVLGEDSVVCTRTPVREFCKVVDNFPERFPEDKFVERTYINLDPQLEYYLGTLVDKAIAENSVYYQDKLAENKAILEECSRELARVTFEKDQLVEKVYSDRQRKLEESCNDSKIVLFCLGMVALFGGVLFL